tara:strand:- start:3327 stop:3980 length:654 start_codon:yes stop_codon:yes gene_type:complete
VPTPIGNLKDITYRAIETLSDVDLILAEDTRVSRKLLSHYNISTKMVSYHMHNEHKITKDIIENLNKGVSIALISDAGTPGISDPGFFLIRTCIENNIQVECLPGATAFVPALVQSGIPNDRFLFEGFLPHKKGRTKKLTQLSKEDKTIILYESPHRLIKTLKDLCQYFGGETQASVSRELTKIHEETIHGTLTTIKNYYSDKKPKGEIVIVVSSNK